MSGIHERHLQAEAGIGQQCEELRQTRLAQEELAQGSAQQTQPTEPEEQNSSAAQGDERNDPHRVWASVKRFLTSLGH